MRASLALATSLLLGAGLGPLAASGSAHEQRSSHHPVRGSVARVLPATSGVTGGVRVQVRGRHLRSVRAVMVGGAKATALRVTGPHRLTAVLPAHRPGSFHVRVVTKAGTSRRVPASRFTYVARTAAPSVSDVSPATGNVAGGNTVTVTGYGFVGVTAVTFGGTAGTSIRVISPNRLTVVSPARGSGPADIQVSTGAGTSTAAAGDRFTYAADVPVPQRPSVTGVSPPIGTPSGGTTVTITGTHLTDVTRVDFGDTPGTSITEVSPTEPTVVSPGHTDEPVDIRVTTAGGTSPITSEDQFLYTYCASSRHGLSPRC